MFWSSALTLSAAACAFVVSAAAGTAKGSGVIEMSVWPAASASCRAPATWSTSIPVPSTAGVTVNPDPVNDTAAGVGSV